MRREWPEVEMVTRIPETVNLEYWSTGVETTPVLQ